MNSLHWKVCIRNRNKAKQKEEQGKNSPAIKELDRKVVISKVVELFRSIDLLATRLSLDLNTLQFLQIGVLSVNKVSQPVLNDK